jgi:hypothetical protein
MQDIKNEQTRQKTPQKRKKNPKSKEDKGGKSAKKPKNGNEDGDEDDSVRLEMPVICALTVLDWRSAALRLSPARPMEDDPSAAFARNYNCAAKPRALFPFKACSSLALV